MQGNTGWQVPGYEVRVQSHYHDNDKVRSSGECVSVSTKFRREEANDGPAHFRTSTLERRDR